MKELSIEKMEMVNGGGCGASSFIGFLGGAIGIGLIIAFPPAAGAAALGAGTTLGLTIGSAIGDCIF
jgi:hypothetical protein